MGPTPVLSTEELRAVEALGLERSPTLMDRAGRAIAFSARRLAEETGAPILVVAGPGNNGGDAWVAARHLAEGGHKVIMLDAVGSVPSAPEAREAHQALEFKAVPILREWPASLHAALIIDGLLGIGLSRDLEGDMAGLVTQINLARVPVLSIDVPSGLDSATGRARGRAVCASQTITFMAHKLGMHTNDGPDHCGIIELDELGMGAEARAHAHGNLLAPATVRPWLGPRRRNAHKGQFGTVGVIGGSRGMVGAPILAARAALVCGAGKVRVGLLAGDVLAVDLAQPELMIGAIDDVLAADVLVVGPGAGRSASATSISQFERSVLPAAIAARKPLVLDADGLNALAYSDGLRKGFAEARKGPTILTPHPAEAARLLNIPTEAIQSDRLGAALDLASTFNAYVVLKGTGSICAFPDGRWSVNTTGNPGLASAGTGDVLAGMIGAFLAQGLEPERALQYAVCLHGAAADALVARGKGPIGLTASEVSGEARRLLNVWTAR